MTESRSDLGEAEGGTEDVLLDRGTTVGRYVVLERLGAGAMGVVYAAYDPELDRKVAIKVLRSRDLANSRRRARLQREAQAIAKLSHANVVSIFDVGVYEGQVFLAMENLTGGTLSKWLAEKKRPWADVLAMFVEIGNGLSAAHAEGLIHRDFKPDNVLLDKAGKPKIVDFGLVRLSSAVDESISTSEEGIPPIAGTASAASASSRSWAALPPADLTHTGAMTGTPAYMAPEQFMGQKVTASSDQFAFCVALWEALYGVAPFAGETAIARATSVVAGALSPVPLGASVPPWIRRVLERGLSLKVGARFPTMADLVREIDRKPITWKRIGAIGGPMLAIAAVVVVVTAIVGGRMRAKAQLEATIGRNLEEAKRHEEAARRNHTIVDDSQAEAARLFDEGSGFLPGGAKSDSWKRAEAAWAHALEAEASAQSEYSLAGAALEAALFVDPKRSEARDRLVGLLDSRLSLAESMYHRDLQSEIEGRLRGVLEAAGKASGFKDQARLIFTTSVGDLRMTIASYIPESARGRLRLGVAREIHGDLDLPGGSYLLMFSRDGRHVVRLPLFLHRRMHTKVALEMPRWSTIPEGFLFVHGGESLIGSNEENIRSGLDMPPMHTLALGSFLVGRFEVTFGQYIAWLGTLPSGERLRRAPKIRSDSGAIELTSSGGQWNLAIQTSPDHRYLAGWGQPIRYSGRSERSLQDWRRFPVTGISYDDACAYAQWLSRTGRVRGAHVCRDEEWERAARGADGRIYSNGWKFTPSEANIDATYGGNEETFGPDEVGSHPESASPFGVDDMEGNAAEMVAAARWAESTALRGGSWYQELVSQRFDSRYRSVRSLRVPLLGFRICAPPEVE